MHSRSRISRGDRRGSRAEFAEDATPTGSGARSVDRSAPGPVTVALSPRSLRPLREIFCALCVSRFAAAVLMLAMVACTTELPYVDSISAWRAEKDRFMQRSSDSPIPPEQRATFPPLSYFPIEPDTGFQHL